MGTELLSLIQYEFFTLTIYIIDFLYPEEVPEHVPEHVPENSPEDYTLLGTVAAPVVVQGNRVAVEGGIAAETGVAANSAMAANAMDIGTTMVD